MYVSHGGDIGGAASSKHGEAAFVQGMADGMLDENFDPPAEGCPRCDHEYRRGYRAGLVERDDANNERSARSN